jgi:5,10-methylenetetrahydromethanopterin reductase
LTLLLELNTNPRSIAHAVELAQAAEAAGYYRFGCWDSPALHLDCWATLMAVAANTSRVKIGPNVTNPLTRHPVVTASAAVAVEEIAPGRTYIGIGTGDSGVYNLGFGAATQQHLGRYVRAVRDLLDEGTAEFGAESLSLAPRPTSYIPIYVATHGPKGLRTAVQFGDGVISGFGLDADVTASVCDRVASSRPGPARGRSDPDIWWVVTAALASEEPRRLSELEWFVGVPAHHLTRFGLRDEFVPQDLAEGVKAIGEAYVVASHGQPSEAELRTYRRVLAEYEPAKGYLCHRFLVLGSHEDVFQRFHELHDQGARQLAVSSGPLISDKEIFDLAGAADRLNSHLASRQMDGGSSSPTPPVHPG